MISLPIINHCNFWCGFKHSDLLLFFLLLSFEKSSGQRWALESPCMPGTRQWNTPHFTHIPPQLDEVKGRNNHNQPVLCCLHLIKCTDTIINQSYVLMVKSQWNIWVMLLIAEEQPSVILPLLCLLLNDRQFAFEAIHEWMSTHAYLFLAFMYLSSVSIIQICFSIYKAATCNMCKSNFVIYICESPVHAFRAACHTICCHPRKAWGSRVTALGGRNWKTFWIRELHLSVGTKHGCEVKTILGMTLIYGVWCTPSAYQTQSAGWCGD